MDNDLSHRVHGQKLKCKYREADTEDPMQRLEKVSAMTRPLEIISTKMTHTQSIPDQLLMVCSGHHFERK